MMKKILLITAGDFTHTGGIERYDSILFKILREKYVNYSIDVILTGYDKSNKVNGNANVIYARKVSSTKNNFLNYLHLFTDVFAIRHFFNTHYNEYKLILDASRIGFPKAKKLDNYYLIQHFDLLKYYIGVYSKKPSFHDALIKIIRKILQNNNFLKLTKNIIVFDEVIKDTIQKYNPNINIIVISLPSFIGSTPVKELSEFNKKHRIIFLGRLSTEKNISALIKINNSLNLIDFYGKPDGINGENYKNTLIQNNWYKGIITNPEELKDTLQKYKFMILYSVSEGFPFSLVESLSQGLPIIVKNTFLSASYLCTSETGLLLPESTNLDEDIKNIENFFSMSDEKYHEFQINCVNFYNKNLSMEQFEQKWLNIFDRYLERK